MDVTKFLLSGSAGDAFRARLRELVTASQRTRSVKVSGGYVVGTSIGFVRRDNQDAAAIVRLRSSDQHDKGLDIAVICDGMGGTNRGREASVLGTVQFIWSMLQSDGEITGRADRAIRSANELIFKRLAGDGGTTLSAIVITGLGEIVSAHAGDSRVYAVDDDGGALQISQDDTLHAALRKGQDEHSDLRSKLIQFVGMGPDFDPHVEQLHQHGRSFLLTTDGVHGVADSTFARFVRASQNGAELVRRGLQLADVLGSGLVDQSQKMTVAASAMAEKNVVGHRS